MKPIKSKPKMNKTEAAWAAVLEIKKQNSSIIDYYFEAIKFKLAPKTFYTPDFLVVGHDSFEIHEVKGFWRDDARVKIKVAADMFPYFNWRVVTYKKGQFHVQDIY